MKVGLAVEDEKGMAAVRAARAVVERVMVVEGMVRVVVAE